MDRLKDNRKQRLPQWWKKIRQKTETRKEKKEDNLFESNEPDAEIWIHSKTTEIMPKKENKAKSTENHAKISPNFSIILPGKRNSIETKKSEQGTENYAKLLRNNKKHQERLPRQQ
jgi:hypothetical protein